MSERLSADRLAAIQARAEEYGGAATAEEVVHCRVDRRALLDHVDALEAENRELRAEAAEVWDAYHRETCSFCATGREKICRWGENPFRSQP